MKIKKIAVFYNLRFGGAKRVVFEHVKGLKNKGYVVDIYTINTENDSLSPQFYANNFYNYNYSEKTLPLPYLGRVINDVRIFTRLRHLHLQIARDIDKRNYDIVLVHPDRITQAPFLLRFLKTVSVYYCQEPLRIAYEYSLRFKDKVNQINRIYEEVIRRFRKEIDRENVRKASFCLASCYHIRERMIESYDVYPKISYLGVDQAVFVPKKVEKKNEVIFIGDKDVVTDGYDLAKEALSNILLPQRPNLTILSWKTNNRERLTDEKLAFLYSRSITTLCLSKLETFGLVPLESMACGTPVIATKVSGHRETVINGKTGFLVDFSPQEIADKLMIFIKHPSVAAEMGRNGRKYIGKKWKWSKQIDELERLLKEFVEK